MGKKKNNNIEFDLHVWKRPGFGPTADVFTISRSRRYLCHEMTIDEVMDAIERELVAAGNPS